ncbi:hypothetical protein EJ02DRAFT_106318 [Clathrospora elynae]|uniref:Uncharacterized protein n=1 Tax=Clathrospora elynae TaxID=706981 RepID=A0A6A5S8R5_9PLEO|nr:hypothetical protein EJ02DRAFT_106318 [Clathrospora elynae]
MRLGADLIEYLRLTRSGLESALRTLFVRAHRLISSSSQIHAPRYSPVLPFDSGYREPPPPQGWRNGALSEGSEWPSSIPVFTWRLALRRPTYQNHGKIWDPPAFDLSLMGFPAHRRHTACYCLGVPPPVRSVLHQIAGALVRHGLSNNLADHHPTMVSDLGSMRFLRYGVRSDLYVPVGS